MLLSLNKRITKSLSFRLAFYFCASFSVFLTAAFVFSYVQLKHSLEKADKEIISSKLHEITSVLLSSDIKGLGLYLSREHRRIANSSFLIRVMTNTGETVFVKPSVQDENFDFEKAFNDTRKLVNANGWHRFNAIDDEDVFDIFIQTVSDNYQVEIGKSSEKREGILEKVLYVFLSIDLLFILLSSLAGFWYSRRALAPIRNLTATIKSIENGDFSKRVLQTGPEDELSDLVYTFNRMADKIDHLIKMMRESLDNVAHDIRTPLTRIRYLAEDALLKDNPVTSISALEECAESSAEISALVDQLMSISEAEAGTLKLKIENCNMTNLLQEVIDVYEFVSIEKKIELHFEKEVAPVFCAIDKKRFKQILGNLLDNALKFSNELTKINFKIIEIDSSVKISIQDQGAGIPQHELTRIWDRLYRGDSSRSTRGLGLGLSIVKSIVVAHKGVIEVSSTINVGSSFTITLPKLQAT